MFLGTLPAATNNSDWIESIRLTDFDDSDPLDFTDVEFEMAVYRDGRTPILTGSTSGGEITTPEDGIVSWQFLAARMSGFCAGTYTVEIKATRDVFETLIGFINLPVYEGQT